MRNPQGERRLCPGRQVLGAGDILGGEGRCSEGGDAENQNKAERSVPRGFHGTASNIASSDFFPSDRR